MTRLSLKKSVDIGFLPILCATPLIMADPLGYYAEQGIKANLLKRAGWALVRDQMMNRELDAAHFWHRCQLPSILDLAQPSRI